MRFRGPPVDQSGFTLIELIVVIAFVSLLALLSYEPLKQQITDAHIKTTIHQMQKLAADVQIYRRNAWGSLQTDNQYDREIKSLYEGQANQIALLNQGMGTDYAASNHFGQPIEVHDNAGNRVFVTTKLPKAIFGSGGPGDFSGVSAYLAGTFYQLTVMAPTYGRSYYLRRSRHVMRILQGNRSEWMTN